MMKRVVALLLLALMLSSCSGQIKEADVTSSDETTTAPVTTEAADTEPEDTDEAYEAPAYEVEEKTLTTEENGVVNVGYERQLFVDSFIIDIAKSDVVINYETPVKQEIAFRFDKGYERGDCVYHNIVKMPDGIYRMYYKAYSGIRRICYIESTDGINWIRPELTTNMQNGQKTNIVTTDDVRPDNLFVFYDTNPDCREGRRLKGVYGQWGEYLNIQYSYNGNGDHFPFSGSFGQNVLGKPPSSGGCYYDTLNTMYWDEYRQQYVTFVRGFHNEKGNYALSASFVTNYPHKIIRDIRVSVSDDGNSWSMPEPLKYGDGADIQMYANAITPYYRSPGLYVALPTRFFEESGDKRTQVFFMTSRDLVNWNRTEEPYLDPDEGDSFSYSQGNGYPCVGIIETAEGEMSFYMKEKSHGSGVPTLYRYTLRADGFTSATGTHLTTKPLNYKGESLEVNFNGEIKVTMTGADGRTVTSEWIKGDEIAQIIEFNGELPEGQSTLTFELKEGTKLYSFKFN